MYKYLICFFFLFLFIGSSYSQKSNSKGMELTQDCIYKEVEGVQLKMHFFYPDKFKKGKKYPTMIFFFGGGWVGGSISQFEDQAKYFASRGVITVLADYRVESRNNTTPFEAVSDAKSAMRYLRIHAKEYGIDSNKIIASGGSAGGHLAAAATLLSGLNEEGEDLPVSSKANALVLFNPVIDNGQGGYGFERIGDRYLEISPIHNIKADAPPTILFLGDKDKLIPVSTVYDYKAKMEAVGSRCDVFIYEGQAHGFFNKGKQAGNECYIETVYESDLFLQSLGYLKGEETIKKVNK